MGLKKTETEQRKGQPFGSGFQCCYERARPLLKWLYEGYQDVSQFGADTTTFTAGALRCLKHQYDTAHAAWKWLARAVLRLILTMSVLVVRHSGSDG